jgi:hypothetical protein
MSIQKNINNSLNQQFKNTDYLPKKLLIEDLDAGILQFLNSLNITVSDEEDNMRKVPIIFLNQERWAEFKNNWKFERDESNEEITMPFMTIRRVSVKPGEHPLKWTTPVKKPFTFVKVPVIDGLYKGYDVFKIPQPPRVDIEYELRFFSHYMQDANVSYEKMIADGFSDGQGYTFINGYYIPIKLGNTSEENTVDDISADRKFQIVYSLSLYGKIVDPTKFERIKAITKIILNIEEK